MAHVGSVTFVYVKFRWRGGGGEINTKNLNFKRLLFLTVRIYITSVKNV